MITLELPAKMLRFLIEAVEFRIAAYAKDVAENALSEDEISDISNDAALLRSLTTELRRKDNEWTNAAAPIGDARARARLRLIMQCLLTEGFSETEQDALILMGSAASLDPAWTDYLYWPVKFGLDGSIDAVLDKAFSYKPIEL
jgi:hypothetical protein